MASTPKSADDGIVGNVKEYYGKTITSTDDFKTSVACTRSSKPPQRIAELIGQIHDDVASKYYGCGLCIPSCLEGCNVLDLGSGAGRDCFIVSKLVGPSGRVTGVDITEEQITFANQYKDYHREKFGLKENNVDFVLGYMEKLAEAGIDSDSHDIIISNCVICLSADKPAVLKEGYRALKTGGEIYFSDMYADRPLPEKLKNSTDTVLWGEGLSGSLYWKELINIAEEVGFSTPRLVDASVININKELLDLVEGTKYASVTYRLFKLPEDRSSETVVRYRGSISDHEDQLTFDWNNTFKKGQAVKVDAELATILRSSRYASHFDFDCDSDLAESASQSIDPNPFAILKESTCSKD
ncbi:arsenite methyltransferase-like [Ptychodera flava]|uniref:arsenite methyltransferase-like n=1 Tax=Ptychodera flava TaxID=63121 RepID=UPI00396A0A6E